MSTDLTVSRSLVDDLDLIGGLDFEPRCDWNHTCDDTATHAVITTMTCKCPDRVHAKPLCLHHVHVALDHYDTNADQPATCRDCRTCKPLRDLLRIDRIEPLR